MTILDDRAERDTLRAWVDALEPALPATLVDDIVWVALAAAARRSRPGCDARLAADASAWLHEAVLPAASEIAFELDVGSDWERYNHERTLTAARALMRRLASSIPLVRRRLQLAVHAGRATGAASCLIDVLAAQRDLHLLQGLRHVVAVAAYDRTVAGSAAAAALIGVVPDRPTFLAEIDPIGALTVLLADVGAEPTITFE